MSSLNKVMIIGNLGKDPDIRNTSDGREIASLTIATSESWTDKNSGERKEKTEWHRVVCFNSGLVTVMRDYLKKGSKVFIEGALQTRKWQDNEGNDKYSTEVVMQGFNCKLIMLDNYGKDKDHQEPEPAPRKSGIGGRPLNSPPSADDYEDDIPF